MSESMMLIILIVALAVVALSFFARPKFPEVDPEILASLPRLVQEPIPLASDVQAWIAQDFDEDSRAEATQVLETSGLDERCQRCALYLAKGEVLKLRQAVDIGQVDWRDLITAGEYDGGIRGILKPARDFSKPQTIPRSLAPNPEIAD